VKPQALLPRLNAAKERWETSVHRPEGLADGETWALGYAYVENVAEKRVIKARAVGPFTLVSDNGLTTDVNGPPFPRHVEIVGWSPDDKDVRLMHATQIADKLQLQIDPRASFK
jgi:hypothetical protein